MRKILPLSVAFIFCSFVAFAQNSRQRDIDAFIAQTGAVATTDKATSSLNFLRFPIGQALNLEGSTPEQKAMAFLAKYPALFEKKTDKDSYHVKENKRDNYGLDHVTLQQYYDRVPVFDGVLKFHFNKEGRLTSLNGNFIIAEKLNATPSISSEEAGQRAIKLFTGQKMGKFSAPLKINKNTLLVFQKGLAQGYRGPLHLVYEVEVRNDADVREFLYIDAHTNELVEQFTGMHGIDRKLYETSASAPNLKWEEANGINSAKFSTLDQWQKSEVESAGHLYNLIKNAFGHVSYDGADATMMTINNNPEVGCPNASWNGTSANYCSGVASDDVVAHEWAHAYTEYTSGLVYAWQAGAMNESYSDIWGETVDQLNGYMDTGETNFSRDGCGSSRRWQIAEQTTAFGGIIRDMWDPTCKGDPGKVSDSKYWCGPNDNGGVHTNSGVLNHAFALLVDGGIYNNQNITGLGLVKAAHIFWHAQANFMSATTDFASQADILLSSLNDLIDINLATLSLNNVPGGLSGQIITIADGLELVKVLNAVELRDENQCGILKPLEPICVGGQPQNAIFFENFESGFGNWSFSNIGESPSWVVRNWIINANPPAGRTGHVAYGIDFQGGSDSDFQNGVLSLTSPVIQIPSVYTGPINMAFDHFVSLEAGLDGGNLKFRINQGIWKLVPSNSFTANGYNMTLLDQNSASNNPMGGQASFSGKAGGSLIGNWGQSRINLTELGLLPGQNIQFQWDLGTDKSGGWDGWYLDDVRVYSCALPSVQFTTKTTVLNEGEAILNNIDPNSCLKYIEKVIQIKINSIPSKPVTVTINASAGSASNGPTSDYLITPSSFTLDSNNLSKDITIRIYNDAYIESIEDIHLSLSLTNPIGGDAFIEAFGQNHKIIIIDDDFAPQLSTFDLISEDFNNGLPPGWVIQGGDNFPSSWTVLMNPVNWTLDKNGPPLLIADSYDSEEPLNVFVESAPVNTMGATAIDLSFIEYFKVLNGGFFEQGIVEVWDGNSWQPLLLQDEGSGSSGSWKEPAIRNIPIPIVYSNSAMKIRLKYIAAWDYAWFVDNLKLRVSYPRNILTTISTTPDNQYLGPNSTVYFRDPTSGDLIAKIKNLTAHDYGCTSVQVDRAGIDETAWIGAKNITKKTFKVTPTNNNPNGNYEITLYYKASELANFNGSDIKSMGKSEGGIQQATAANSVTAPVQMAMFNSDYAYTATFNSGFSGFGLSDAPAGGALPVTLFSFEGKHSFEGNLLLWETSSEVNNDYFVVERSRDARKFDEIAKVAGVGTSAVSNAYSFTDSNYDKGLNYYRLKQVDTDGSFAYSKMIAIESDGTRPIKYFPNPVQSSLSIELPNHEMQQYNVKVFNSAGQCVLTKEKIKSNKGKMFLDVAKLPAGVYQVFISNEANVHNFSVVKIP